MMLGFRGTGAPGSCSRPSHPLHQGLALQRSPTFCRGAFHTLPANSGPLTTVHSSSATLLAPVSPAPVFPQQLELLDPVSPQQPTPVNPELPESTRFAFDSYQRRFLESDSHYALVEAGAGSGKTTTLIQAAVDRYRAGVNVLITSKNSVNMHDIKERLLTQHGLQLKQRGEGSHFILEGPACSIEVATVDGFVHDLLAQLAREGDEVVQDFLKKRSFEFPLKVQHAAQYAASARFTGGAVLGAKDVQGVTRKVDLLIVDEVQDLHTDATELLLQLAEHHPRMRLWGFGDKLQSIWDNTITKEGQHALEQWARLPLLKRFPMPVCHRCPRNHITFRNEVMQASDDKYLCKPLQPTPGKPAGEETKVILFPYPRVSSQQESSAHTAAEMVLALLSALAQEFPDLDLSHSTYLAPRPNDNPILSALEALLILQAKAGSVIYQRTRCKERGPIKCNHPAARDKKVLESITAAKGLTYSVAVAFLPGDLLPQMRDIGTPFELNSDSLINVALTRSERVALIGYPADELEGEDGRTVWCYDPPSLIKRVLMTPHSPARGSFINLADPQVPGSLAEKLRQVMLSVPGCPSSDFTYAPDQAHEDSGSCNIAVSSAVQRVQTRYQLLRESEKDLPVPEMKRFGEPFKVLKDSTWDQWAHMVQATAHDEPTADDLAPLLGAMSVPLLERIYHERRGTLQQYNQKYEYLADTPNHYQASLSQEDQLKLLAIERDYRLNGYAMQYQTEQCPSERDKLNQQWLQKLEIAHSRDIIDKGGVKRPRHSPGVHKALRDLRSQPSPKYIVPPFCGTQQFQDSMKEVLSSTGPTLELAPRAMWHLTLALSASDQKDIGRTFRRKLLNFWEAHNIGDYYRICNNLEALMTCICKMAHCPPNNPPVCVFEKPVWLSAPPGYLTPDGEKVKGSIEGRIDVYVPFLHMVLELKQPLVPSVSHSKEHSWEAKDFFHPEWQVQALLYGIINGPQAVSRVGVVNITAGRLLLYKHQGRRPLFSRDQQLAGVKSVTDAYKWKPDMQDGMFAGVDAQWAKYEQRVKSSNASGTHAPAPATSVLNAHPSTNASSSPAASASASLPSPAPSHGARSTSTSFRGGSQAATTMTTSPSGSYRGSATSSRARPSCSPSVTAPWETPGAFAKARRARAARGDGGSSTRPPGAQQQGSRESDSGSSNGNGAISVDPIQGEGGDVQPVAGALQAAAATMLQAPAQASLDRSAIENEAPAAKSPNGKRRGRRRKEEEGGPGSQAGSAAQDSSAEGVEQLNRRGRQKRKGEEAVVASAL